MADEQLGVRVAVEGFADFNRAFDAMNKKIGESATAMGGLEKPAQGINLAFDKNVAQSNKLKLAMLELATTEGKLATETDALSRAQIEVKADSLREQINNLNKSAQEGSKGFKLFGMSLTDIKSGIDMAVGAAKTAAAAFKAVFDFAKEGAGILQAQETVERLGINLEELRKASGGTVDDMTLITSAAKLLAGTTGELNDRMAEAAPRLLEIARAAVKLDPTIGDVAFVYESLSRGIKKNQPLLIDNANIVVKVGQANEILAAKLGKTVQQLTDEEKSMALLDATLKSGANVIEQVGGTLDSATDSYAKLETSLKNTTDALKAQFAEAVGPAADAWSQHYMALEATDRKLYSLSNIFDSLRVLITGNSKAIEEYNQQLAATEFIDGYANAMSGAVDATKKSIEAQVEAKFASESSAMAYGEYTDDVNLAIASQGAFNALLAESKGGWDADKASIDLYKAGLEGVIGKEMADFSAKQSELTEKGEELRKKISELEQKRWLTPEQRSELDELRGKLEDNALAIDVNAAKHEEATARILLSFAEQRLGMDGLTQDELMALQELAKNWGLMDSATLTAIKSIDDYASSAEAAGGDMDSFIEKTKGLKDALLAIPTSVNVKIRIATEGAMPSLPGGPENRGTVGAYQHGGTPSGRSILTGEYGAELLTGVPSSARVLSHPTTARMISQSNSTTNQYNLTTQSLLRPGGLAMEFASMEMGSR